MQKIRGKKTEKGKKKERMNELGGSPRGTGSLPLGMNVSAKGVTDPACSSYDISHIFLPRGGGSKGIWITLGSLDTYLVSLTDPSLSFYLLGKNKKPELSADTSMVRTRLSRTEPVRQGHTYTYVHTYNLHQPAHKNSVGN